MTLSVTGRRHDRLREHLLTGPDGELTDEELLELLLGSALHRRDVQHLATELIRRFGSLATVLSASPRELRRINGVGEAVIVLLKLVNRLRLLHRDPRLPIHVAGSQTQPAQTSLPLFRERAEIERLEEHSETAAPTDEPTKPLGAATSPPRRVEPSRDLIRAIQDLIWKEAILSLPWSERFDDAREFQAYICEHLPQNSLSTRDRYAQTLIRWFYPDGMQGLAAQVWKKYQDPVLSEEILRYLYLQAEPLAGTVVADALFPISENAVIPESYINRFIEDRFGPEIPAKSVERLKANLRKLGFLAFAKGHRDSLRAVSPSATAFLILLHFRFAHDSPGGIEFRTLASDPFWKYLGFKSEDRLRSILREGFDRGLVAKYVVADRIESVSLRFSFREFVEGRMRP